MKLKFAQTLGEVKGKKINLQTNSQIQGKKIHIFQLKSRFGNAVPLFVVFFLFLKFLVRTLFQECDR